MRIPFLSFFTGGGFLDIGFEQAGFVPVSTNQNNSIFAELYSYGVTSWRHSLQSDAPKARITFPQNVNELAPGVVLDRAFGTNKPDVFGVIGGPPCTDFSAGGNNLGVNGNYGNLVGTFVELIGAIQPAFFVIENVPGLVRHKEHRRFFTELVDRLRITYEYAVDHCILSALELGIPQDRDRLFVVGFRRSLFANLPPPSGILETTGWFPWPEAKYPGAKRLPWPTTNPFQAQVDVPEGIPLELTVYPLLFDPDPEILPNGKEYFQPHSIEKYERLYEGDVSGKSFKRLHRYRYSPTAWYGNNEVHLHPTKPRRLSVREALRIQTVPDEYVLPEDFPLTHKFKLICNGVPCRLAEELARSIHRFLEGD